MFISRLQFKRTFTHKILSKPNPWLLCFLLFLSTVAAMISIHSALCHFCQQHQMFCERFESRSHFKSGLILIVRVNVVLNKTVVVDGDWRFDNLCCSHLQSQNVFPRGLASASTAIPSYFLSRATPIRVLFCNTHETCKKHVWIQSLARIVVQCRHKHLNNTQQRSECFEIGQKDPFVKDYPSVHVHARQPFLTFIHLSRNCIYHFLICQSFFMKRILNIFKININIIESQC